MKQYNDIESSFDKKALFSEGTTSFGDRFFKTLKSNSSPSFFIVGAQKAGTSSLAYNLCKHPKIEAPKQKEIYFFNNELFYQKGLKWYSSHFPKKNENATITFDATANYFESQLAPQKIKKLFPDAKIIIMLRNPIERAFSHYKMMVNFGVEKLSFEEALEMEEKRLSFSKNNYLRECKHDYVFQRLAYRTKGVYVNFLQNWLKYFSLEELLIIESETYFEKPDLIFQKVINNLDVDPFIPSSFDLINKGNNNQMLLETRERLKKFYQPFNEELFQLIGENYNWQ